MVASAQELYKNICFKFRNPKKQKFLPVSTALKETSKTNKKIAG